MALQDKVYTRLGKGRIVYIFPDTTVAVEFDYGGGHVFMPHEVFLPTPPARQREVYSSAFVDTAA
jgi:hypothetical protein